MSYMWMSHVTHVDGSCHIFDVNPINYVEWVYSQIVSHASHVKQGMLRIWIIQVAPRMNGSRHVTYECVKPHRRISHVIHMIQSCHAHEWVVSQIWMNHITRVNESRHVEGFRLVRVFAHVCVTWPIHTCEMTHPCVWQDLVMRVTWPIHMCNMTYSCEWHDSSTRVTWGLSMCMTWKSHLCGITCSYVWHDSCETESLHSKDMVEARICVRHGSATRCNTLQHNVAHCNTHCTARTQRH